MGTKHKDLTATDLHVPGVIDTTDPATTYGTSEVSDPPGVFAGLLWVEESSTDNPTALKYRNSANSAWVEIIGSSAASIPSVATGDILYASAADTLSALTIGTARQLLQTNAAGTLPEWTSDVDVPGTLDVTGATTLDAGLTVAGAVTLDIGAGAFVVKDGSAIIHADGSTGQIGLGAIPDDDIGLLLDTPALAVTDNTDYSRLRIKASGALTIAASTTSPLVATARFDEPNITLASGAAVTEAATVYVHDAPTEGGSNYAILVNSGATSLGGTLDVTGAVTLSTPLAVANLADGTARQLLQTDAAGTGVEWASNIDVPGTLDVTGVVTLDSTVTSVGAATLDTGANGSSFGGGLGVAGLLTVQRSVGETVRVINDTAAVAGTDVNIGGRLGNSGGGINVAGTISFRAEGTWGTVSGTRYASIVIKSVEDGDVKDRLLVDSAGTFWFDPASAKDTNLYRSAADTLKTDDSLVVSLGFEHQGSTYGIFGATPVAQPTTAIAEAAFVENSGGTAVNVDSTFGGYTIQQIAQALQDLGAIA